jgi:hypothetical protein
MPAPLLLEIHCMSIVLRLSACLLMTAALAACNKSEPVAPTAATDMPSTAPAAPTTQPPTPVATTTDDVHVALDMDKVKAYMQAQANLAHAAEADPAMGDPAQNLSEENTEQYIARMDANPKMRAAIEAAGLSPRDFANIGDTFLGAMMAQAALESGQLKTLPEGIDPASVEFVKQHNAEIQALAQGGASGS